MSTSTRLRPPPTAACLFCEERRFTNVTEPVGRMLRFEPAATQVACQVED
jgi:hypothetical protein